MTPIWLVFLAAEGKRALTNPSYWPYIALLLAAMAVRIAARKARPV